VYSKFEFDFRSRNSSYGSCCSKNLFPYIISKKKEKLSRFLNTIEEGFKKVDNLKLFGVLTVIFEQYCIDIYCEQSTYITKC